MKITKTLRLSDDLSSQVDDFICLFDRLIKTFEQKKNITVIACGRTILFHNLEGEKSMYTLPRDHAEEAYTLAPVTVEDSEGAVNFTEEFVSSDSSVVEIVATDAASGVIRFGTNGVADLRRNVKVGSLVVFSEAANFTITPGTVTASGGGISFPGLTPDPEPEPTPEA